MTTPRTCAVGGCGTVSSDMRRGERHSGGVATGGGKTPGVGAGESIDDEKYDVAESAGEGVSMSGACGVGKLDGSEPDEAGTDGEAARARRRRLARWFWK